MSKLNPGWHEGTIGVPSNGKSNIAHYYIKCFDKPNSKGIDGGKIQGLIININNQTKCYYWDGVWQIGSPNADDETAIAYAICLLEHN